MSSNGNADCINSIATVVYLLYVYKHESRQRILSKNKKRKREEGKSPFLKGC